jgi:UMF1 family MFS transporter
VVRAALTYRRHLPIPFMGQTPTTARVHSPSRASALERWSWASYDFANTIFSMNVATLYFSVWLVSDLGASNTLYAAASAIAALLVVMAIPVLGAVSDARRRRKPWVVWFTIVCCGACIAIGVLGQRSLPLIGESVADPRAAPAGWHAGWFELRWVLLAFIVANACYQAALPFYNAMMPDLAPGEEQGRLSGLGTALGYVGSIAGVLLVVPFFNHALPLIGALRPQTIAFLQRAMPYTSHGGRVSTFAPTGVIFFVLSLPLILFCRDHAPATVRARVAWREAFREVAHTLRDARKHPGCLRFIVTSFLYQDAIGTIVGFMTLYAVKAVGFERGSETTLFVVLTIPAVIGSYVAGHLTDRFGARRTLQVTLAAWVVLLIGLIVVPTKSAFWGIGLGIGLVFGGVPTTERPVLLSLVPQEEAGRYFSLMLLSARAAAVVGPLLWGITVDGLEGPFGTALAYRAAVAVVAAMFLGATWLLRGVPDLPVKTVPVDQARTA